MFKKCSKCKKYSNKGDMLLCLLCGEIVCFNHCHNTSMSYAPDKLKNGQRHALKQHCGNAIFLGLYKNDYYVVFQGRGLYWQGSAYAGKYGQTDLEQVRSYKTVKLDRKLLKSLVGGLKEQRFSQLCYYRHVKLHGTGERPIFNQPMLNQ